MDSEGRPARVDSGEFSNLFYFSEGRLILIAFVQTSQSVFDRHRGGGHPPTPATPPCVRVRTRRFESVTLTLIDQCRKSKRFEVSIRKSHGEGFGRGEVPGAESATSRVAGQSRANPKL